MKKLSDKMKINILINFMKWISKNKILEYDIYKLYLNLSYLVNENTMIAWFNEYQSDKKIRVNI